MSSSGDTPTFNLTAEFVEALDKLHGFPFKEISEVNKDVPVLTMARYCVELLSMMSMAELNFLQPLIIPLAKEFYNVYYQTLWEMTSEEDKVKLVSTLTSLKGQEL